MKECVSKSRWSEKDRIQDFYSERYFSPGASTKKTLKNASKIRLSAFLLRFTSWREISGGQTLKLHSPFSKFTFCKRRMLRCLKRQI